MFTLVKVFVLLCKNVHFLLQQLDSIHVTILQKEEGAGLGFSLAGGSDLENKVITVSDPGTGPREGHPLARKGLVWAMRGPQATGWELKAGSARGGTESVCVRQHWGRQSGGPMSTPITILHQQKRPLIPHSRGL